MKYYNFLRNLSIKNEIKSVICFKAGSSCSADETGKSYIRSLHFIQYYDILGKPVIYKRILYGNKDRSKKNEKRTKCVKNNKSYNIAIQI